MRRVLRVAWLIVGLAAWSPYNLWLAHRQGLSLRSLYYWAIWWEWHHDDDSMLEIVGLCHIAGCDRPDGHTGSHGAY